MFPPPPTGYLRLFFHPSPLLHKSVDFRRIDLMLTCSHLYVTENFLFYTQLFIDFIRLASGFNYGYSLDDATLLQIV